MSHAVIIKNAVKKYGDFTALNGVSLDSKQGEFFTRLGPSGCGKSTLIKIISGDGFSHRQLDLIYVIGSNCVYQCINIRLWAEVMASHSIIHSFPPTIYKSTVIKIS